MKDATYYFHQTPKDLAKDLLPFVKFSSTDILFEPFRGEGAFYDAFPETNPKLWSEIEEGVDYKSITAKYDWVISNPPFRLETNGKRENAFWTILNYFTQKDIKGIAFLGNDACFCTLTPRRLLTLRERGFSISKIVVSSVKEWRGRYFFIILTKEKTDFYQTLERTYSHGALKEESQQQTTT